VREKNGELSRPRPIFMNLDLKKWKQIETCWASVQAVHLKATLRALVPNILSNVNTNHNLQGAFFLPLSIDSTNHDQTARCGSTSPNFKRFEINKLVSYLLSGQMDGSRYDTGPMDVQNGAAIYD
jgi:hypothetical protein